MTVLELETNAKNKLHDANVLFTNGSWDSAVYLGGYVVELALKARICKTLSWNEFPVTGKDYENLRTHKLDVLLHFSGIEASISQNNALKQEWEYLLGSWSPEMRYAIPGTINKRIATLFFKSLNKIYPFL